MGATRKSKVGGTHVPAGNKNGTQNTEKRSPRPLPTKPGATVTPQNELSGSQQPKRKKKRRKRVPESDSAVSRQDVELQESDKLTKRPMPSIPVGHDAKGRGLSANYDDDHPMISVGIPSKKAGALDPLHEDKGDQERKKKKKKKNTENVEEDE